MLLEKLHKKMSKELRKIKAVIVYVGDKKAKVKFTRLNDDQFKVEVRYKCRRKKDEISFNEMTMINKATGEKIKVRRLDRVYVVTKGDIYICNWVILSSLNEY